MVNDIGKLLMTTVSLLETRKSSNFDFIIMKKQLDKSHIMKNVRAAKQIINHLLVGSVVIGAEFRIW
jgi:hypothetical protein